MRRQAGHDLDLDLVHRVALAVRKSADRDEPVLTTPEAWSTPG